MKYPKLRIVSTLLMTFFCWAVATNVEKSLESIIPDWWSDFQKYYWYIVVIIGGLLLLLSQLILSVKSLKDQIDEMVVPTNNIDFDEAIAFVKKKWRWRKVDNFIVQRSLEQAALLGAIVAFGRPCGDVFNGPHAEKHEIIPPEFSRNCEGARLADGEIELDEFGFTLTNFDSERNNSDNYVNVMFNKEQIRIWRSRGKPFKS